MLPASPYQVQRVGPARPFFVVMTMTPFAASVPYSVAADGPFTISMSSISSGDIVLRKLNVVPPLLGALKELESARTPSTKTIGALPRLSELRPRIRIFGADPVAP